MPNSARLHHSSLGFAAILSVALTAPALASEPRPEWTGDFAIPAFDGATTACAIFRGQYVVAGNFNFASEVRASNVAIWTGSEWEQAGDGLPARVGKLAVWGNQLLAGTSSNGPGSSPVMILDGASWQPLGSTLYGETTALLVAGADVYAAGLFYQVGSTNGERVLRWNGVDWEEVGGAFDGRILALGIYDGALYAGGEFLSSDAGYVSRIARWDGAHWVAVDGGISPGGNAGSHVSAITEFEGQLIAAGSFTSIGNIAANGIAAWNGTTWSPLPETPVDVIVTDLEAEGAILHVTGVLQMPGQWAAGLVEFDGEHWTPPSTYPGWGIADVATGGGALIAVGDHSDLASSMSVAQTRDVLVRDPGWHDLVSWRSTMRGFRGPTWTAVDALLVHEGSLYAGGYFYEAANPPEWEPTVGLARWDGDRWRTLEGERHGWVYEMTSWRGLLVTGSYGFGSIGISAVQAWDGAQSSDLGAPLAGWIGGLTVWQNSLVAVGSLRVGETGDFLGVLVYDGSTWQPLGESLIGPNTRIMTAAVINEELYVGGSQLEISGVGSRSLVRWRNNSWEQVPETPLGGVTSLLPLVDGLWVGGAGGRRYPGAGVWRWDGRQWSNMGDLAGDVQSLAEVNGRALVTGTLATINGPTTVAYWNGTEFVGVQDSPNLGPVTAAQLGPDVFLGGTFTRAGGRPAEAIARWTPAPGVLPVLGPRIALRAGPNPASSHVNFRFTLTYPGRVQITIFDLRGALVAHPVDETLPAGTVERQWSPFGTVPPGVYFARVQAPEGEAVTRVVIVD